MSGGERLPTRVTGSADAMEQGSDRDERLQALYGLRENVVERIEVDDRATRSIIAAVDSLIEEYGGAPPGEDRSNHGSDREA